MKKNNKKSVSSYVLSKIIDMKSKRFLNKGRAYSYNSIMNWIKFSNLWQKFEKATNSGIIYLDDVTMDTYYGFMNFCDSHNYKESSKYLYCTIFKTVLNYSYYDGISVNCISRNRNFITHCSTNNIKHTYLNKNEIEKIYSLNLKGMGVIEKVRDIFLIGCYTGQRVSDYSSISANDIIYLEVKGKKYPVITKVQKKTGTQVLIPILNTAVIDIMNKWGGKVPKVSISSINSKIKEICQKAGIDNYMKISSHTARRSCITNLYLEKKLDIIQIKSISGHKSEESFYRYICMTEEERAKSIISTIISN